VIGVSLKATISERGVKMAETEIFSERNNPLIKIFSFSVMFLSK